MVNLLIATRNAHKVEEIRAILGQGFLYLALDAFPGAPEVVEDAGTFAGNATKKSVGLAKWLAETRAAGPLYVLADDSGLEVDALGGAPGVHSARFAALDSGTAGNSASADNNAKLLRLLGNLPREKRTARFRCVLALTPVPLGQTELFEGVCEGRIDFAPRGQRGFGYDPLFVPTGYEATFGELSEEVKNGISHRAKALQELRRRLRSAQ
jgi:XTP/dITP diphosphohydrolase